MMMKMMMMMMMMKMMMLSLGSFMENNAQNSMIRFFGTKLQLYLDLFSSVALTYKTSYQKLTTCSKEIMKTARYF